MRITIMGSGGTGAYFGAKLVQSGNDVTFIARGAHLQALQTAGLRVTGQEEFHLRSVQAVEDPAGLPPADVVLFAVKVYDTDTALRLIHPVVRPETMVVPIQNGVESYDRLGAAFGHARVVGGLCRISAEIASPGVIRLNSPFREVILGEMDGSASRRTQAFVDSLVEAGLDARTSTNIRADLWKKFAFITALSALTGATRTAIGPIVECPETFALYRQVAEEVVAVARAEGVTIGSDLVDKLVAQAHTLPAGMKASLLVDLERGRPTEVETLQGAVVRLGCKHGVPTPVTATIYALLKLHQPA